MKNILHIDSSGRNQGSVTRQASKIIVNQLLTKFPNSLVVSRDVADGVPFVDEQWVTANFTEKNQRTDKQNIKLSLSDALVNELQIADYIIIGAPVYNFSIPASLKAWIDMVARVAVTFKYTQNGPIGLLENKKAYITIASGGIEIGKEYDFSSSYLKHVLTFLGITDVTIIDVNKFDLSKPDQINMLSL
ncbi:FMN-dependent NADH-azoreductase [hydrothermal vent metagenome]|uniref:FMN-dependent NADH-azoreductase n=1 Tax=hydrothermal vent metagenome TaxID=652676 RepID=A0A3B0VPK8_9ZZZZ